MPSNQLLISMIVIVTVCMTGCMRMVVTDTPSKNHDLVLRVHSVLPISSLKHNGHGIMAFHRESMFLVTIPNIELSYETTHLYISITNSSSETAYLLSDFDLNNVLVNMSGRMNSIGTNFQDSEGHRWRLANYMLVNRGDEGFPYYTIPLLAGETRTWNYVTTFGTLVPERNGVLSTKVPKILPERFHYEIVGSPGIRALPIRDGKWGDEKILSIYGSGECVVRTSGSNQK